MATVARPHSGTEGTKGKEQAQNTDGGCTQHTEVRPVLGGEVMTHCPSCPIHPCISWAPLFSMCFSPRIHLLCKQIFQSLLIMLPGIPGLPIWYHMLTSLVLSVRASLGGLLGCLRWHVL